MLTWNIFAFLVLGFIVYINALRCHSNGPSEIIDCPEDANDVCASAYCTTADPNLKGMFWIRACISGFDKASACKALDTEYCNKPGENPWIMDVCEICSKDECNVYGFKDEPEWRKTTPNSEPISTTQIEPELVKSTDDHPTPISTKKEPETTTTIDDDFDETNNANLFNNGYRMLISIFFGYSFYKMVFLPII